MGTTSEWIVIYDGTCGLCNASVNFIAHRRKAKKFRLIPIQSDEGKAFAAKAKIVALNPDSVIFFDGSDYFIKSNAALEIAKRLGGLWPIFYVFKIVPTGLRDLIYDFVARHRHKFFKQKDVCEI